MTHFSGSEVIFETSQSTPDDICKVPYNFNQDAISWKGQEMNETKQNKKVIWVAIYIKHILIDKERESSEEDW